MQDRAPRTERLSPDGVPGVGGTGVIVKFVFAIDQPAIEVNKRVGVCATPISIEI